MAALIESIRKVGILEPVLVRLNRQQGRGYELVCGARRTRAAKSARLAEVPALVKELSDEQVVAIQLDENLQREGLHPVDEAALFEYAVQHGMSAEKIAARHGLTPAHVRQRLQLCNLVDEVREQYKAGLLHHSVAFAVARIPAAMQEEAAQQMQHIAARWRDDDLAGDLEQLCWAIRDKFMTSLRHAPFDVADETLPPRACTACPRRSDAQHELFPELMLDSEAYCLEPGCFQGKIDESWRRARAEAEAKGLAVLEGEHATKAKSNTVARDASAVWTQTGKHKTYEQVIKGAKVNVTPVLVQGERGQPELRYPKKEAQLAVKKYEEKHAAKLSAKPSARAESSAAAKRERERRELQQKLLELAVVKIGVAGAEKAPKALWQAVLDVVLAICAETGDSVLEAAKARGMAIEDGGIEVDVAALRAKMTGEAKARGLALELLARELVPSWSAAREWPEAFAHLCAVLQIDLVALEAELMPKAERRGAGKRGAQAPARRRA